MFRKVGGFVYVMSVLVSMEGCLADPPKAPWDTGEGGYGLRESVLFQNGSVQIGHMFILSDFLGVHKGHDTSSNPTQLLSGKGA